MAKSGMYLNGKELLECQWEKLTEIEKVQCQLETHIKISHGDLYKIFCKENKEENK